MGAFAKIAGVWEAFDPKVKVAGVWEDVQTGYVKVAGVWEVFYSGVTPVSLNVAPAFVSGQGQGLVVSDPATGTPSNGVGPFTYQWSKVSGDTLGIGSPTNATSVFSGNVPPAGSLNAVYRLTVTDTGNSNTTAFDDVDVTLIDEL